MPVGGADGGLAGATGSGPGRGRDRGRHALPLPAGIAELLRPGIGLDDGIRIGGFFDPLLVLGRALTAIPLLSDASAGLLVSHMVLVDATRSPAPWLDVAWHLILCWSWASAWRR